MDPGDLMTEQEIEKWRKALQLAKDTGNVVLENTAKEHLRDLGVRVNGSVPAPQPEPEPAEDPPTIEETTIPEDKVVAVAGVPPSRTPGLIDELEAWTGYINSQRDEREVRLLTPFEAGHRTFRLALIEEDVEGNHIDTHLVENYFAKVKKGASEYPQPFHISGPQHTVMPPENTRKIVQHYAGKDMWKIHSEWVDDYAYVGRVILDDLGEHGKYGMMFTASCDSSLSERIQGVLYFHDRFGNLVPFSSKLLGGRKRKYTSGLDVSGDRLHKDVMEISDGLEDMIPRLEDFQKEQTEDHRAILERMLAMANNTGRKLPADCMPQCIDTEEGILDSLVPPTLWDLFLEIVNNVWDKDFSTETTRLTYWGYIDDIFGPVDTYLTLRDL